MNEVGIAVLPIRNADLLTKCKAPTDVVHLFASVQAANELIDSTPTIIHFGLTNL